MPLCCMGVQLARPCCLCPILRASLVCGSEAGSFFSVFGVTLAGGRTVGSPCMLSELSVSLLTRDWLLCFRGIGAQRQPCAAGWMCAMPR